jgi:hypothetical protein
MREGALWKDHPWDSTKQEAEAGDAIVQGQPGLHIERPSQNNKAKPRKASGASRDKQLMPPGREER